MTPGGTSRSAAAPIGESVRAVRGLRPSVQVEHDALLAAAMNGYKAIDARRLPPGGSTVTTSSPKSARVLFLACASRRGCGPIWKPEDRCGPRSSGASPWQC